MSKIEWTDDTNNPITVKGGGHWCRKISLLELDGKLWSELP